MPTLALQFAEKPVHNQSFKSLRPVGNQLFKSDQKWVLLTILNLMPIMTNRLQF